MIPHGYLVHHGIIGQKWGVRRYQNKDGSLTSAGKKRYGEDSESDKIEKIEPRVIYENKYGRDYTTGGYKLKTDNGVFDVEDEYNESYWKHPQTNKTIHTKNYFQKITDKQGTSYYLPGSMNDKKYTPEELRPILTTASKHKESLRKAAIENIISSERSKGWMDTFGLTKEDLQKLDVGAMDINDKGNGLVTLWYNNNKDDKIMGHIISMDMHDWKIKKGSGYSMDG